MKLKEKFLVLFSENNSFIEKLQKEYLKAMGSVFKSKDNEKITRKLLKKFCVDILNYIQLVTLLWSMDQPLHSSDNTQKFWNAVAYIRLDQTCAKANMLIPCFYFSSSLLIFSFIILMLLLYIKRKYLHEFFV